MQGIIIKNVANLHRDKSTDSELVSQAVMGQTVQIERDDGEWLYVETWDTYHGWIQSRWVSHLVPQPARIATVTSLFTDALRTPDPNGGVCTKLAITTAIEFLGMEGDLVRVRLPDGNEAWVIGEDVEVGVAGEEKPALGPIGPELVRAAKRFLGVPYLWGGTTPFGMDCSGFVQLVHRIHGVRLLRDAHMQADDPHAEPVNKVELTAGDLIFFAHREDITHVGMACGDGTFIHSAGGIGVTISRLDDEPYRRDFQGARRMSGGPQTPLQNA